MTTKPLKRDDYLRFQKWAQDCLKADCHFDSRSAFRLIEGLCWHAARRGQRPLTNQPQSAPQWRSG